MSFTIAAAQSQSVKGNVATNVDRHAEFVRVAAENHADAIAFPELSLSGYEPTIAAEVALSPDESVLLPLVELSSDLRITILAGAPICSGEARPYIGTVIFSPGQKPSVYRKRFVHSSEEEHFISSPDVVVCTAAQRKIGVAICADIHQPVHPVDLIRKSASIYSAGVMMVPEDVGRAEARLSGYASEHGILTVMANYSATTGGFPTGGRSAAWDESGRVVAQASDHGDCLVIATEVPGGWKGQVIDCEAGSGKSA